LIVISININEMLGKAGAGKKRGFLAILGEEKNQGGKGQGKGGT